jgi:alpha-galactosidase
MGYNSWYGHGPFINESLIKGVADSWATNGLRAAGYEYLCLDDGWQGYRDTNGFIVADTNKFPNGIKSLADYVHAKGFKLGLYSTFARTTCANLPGSCGHVVQDANTFAAWGIDYLKYEGCGSCGPDDSVRTQCQLMGDALRNCGRTIFFNMSIVDAEDWMPAELNSFRGTGDWSYPHFGSFLFHLDFVAGSPQLAGPGHWNDPDILMTSISDLSREEKMSTFGMCCMVAAPLLLANFDYSYLDILTNADVIAVDQDPAGAQGTCILTNGDLQIWSKPLGTNGTTQAVALFNRGTTSADMTVTWAALGIPGGVVAVRDLWARGYVGNITNSFTNGYTVNVPAHGCRLLKVMPGTIPVPPAGTNFVSDMEWSAASVNTNPYPASRNISFGGNQLTLHGITYAKGLAAYPYSRFEYLLSGVASRFISDIGVDDEACCGWASLIFRVWSDGKLLYDSGIMTSSSPTQTIDVDITGCNRLVLEVLLGADDAVNNRADWANARIVVSDTPSLPSANASGQRIDLSWFPVSGAVSYNVRRATNPGGPYTLIGNSAGLTFSDANVVGDTIYYYVISAVGPAGESAGSVELPVELPATWNNTVVAAPQNWNADNNWTTTSSFPNRIGKPAALTADIPGNQSILLNQPITLGSLSMGDPDGSASYSVIGNGGTLVFDNGTSPANVMQLAGSRGDTLACSLNVSGILQVANFSDQPLTIAGSNSFGGTVVIEQGILRVGNDAALGGPAGVTSVQAGGTIDFNGFDVGAEWLTIAGDGFNAAGALINNNPSQTGGCSMVTLKADATLGGTGDWAIHGTNDATLSATLSTESKAQTIYKTGPNTVALKSVNLDPVLADIHISQGSLAFEFATTSLGNPAKTITVGPGASLSLGYCSNVLNKKLVLMGDDGITAALNNVGGSNTVAGPISLAGDCGIGGNDGTLILGGSVSGGGGLVKVGSNHVCFYGPALYTGGTVVHGGELSLINSNAVAGTNFSVDAGGTLDVSALGTFALPTGGTLGGSGTVLGTVIAGSEAQITPTLSGGALTFSNSLSLISDSAGCAFTIRKQPLTNSQIRVTGPIVFGGTLLINEVLGTNSFVSGDEFQLFNVASCSGAFKQIIPPVPAVGFLWDTSDLSSRGILRVVATQVPQLGPLVLAGDNFILSGSGGLAGGPGKTYYVLGSTNPALPAGQWLRLATGQFDANNNFVFVDPSSMRIAPRAFFYRVQVP